MTPDQKKAYDAIVGTVQRVAMKILKSPPGLREQAFTIARKNYEESFARHGYQSDDPVVRETIDQIMEGIRVLV